MQFQRAKLPTLLLCVLSISFISCTPVSNSKPSLSSKPQLTIGKTSVEIDIADTPALREQGLSGRERLGANEGMLFIFENPAIYSFWMIDMKFPLDMIWISEEKKVVATTKNVPFPVPGTSNAQLPIYNPPSPVQYILEVNAGFADRNGINIGDSVLF
jgi:hypothetical protein